MAGTETVKESVELHRALRGEPQMQFDYVVALAAMIYLRWLDFQDGEAEAMAAFDDSEYLALLPASLHWRRWCQLPPSELSPFFDEALPQGIERSGHSGHPLTGSLRRMLPVLHSVSRLTTSSLGLLRGWLLSQPFETPGSRHRLLALFDDLVDRSNGYEIGEFRTPSCISELLVALAAPAKGQRLYDPCFGFAGLLTTAWNAVLKNGREEFARTTEDPLGIAGVERNPQAFVVGMARLALAGVSHPQLELGDSLERKSVRSPLRDGFDLVICNPPWGVKVQPYGLDHFPIQTTDGTSLFIQHALSQLRPNGRAVVVVPQGFLFQQGKTATVRQWLIERHRVEAVVGLPAGAFQPYTAVQSSILIIRRGGGPTQSVQMVDGASFFESRKGKRPIRILPEQITALRNALGNAHSSPAVWSMPTKMLADLGYDLSAVRRETSGLEQALQLLGKEVPIRPLKELCRITAGRSMKSSEMLDDPVGEHSVPYIRTGDLHRGQTVKNASWLSENAAARLGPHQRLRAGDVLLSKAGTIGKAGVVRDGAVGGVASGTLFTISPISSRIDPYFLTAYLMCKDCQEWLKARSSGSVISGLRKQFIEQLPVPVPLPQIQERIAADFRYHQVDALTQLTQLLTDNEEDLLLVKWIDRSLKALAGSPPSEGEDASAIVRLRIFGSYFGDLQAWAIPDNDPPPLMSWALNLANVAELFSGSEEVPPGPALLGMLQSGATDISFAGSQIKGHSPLEIKARELTAAVIQRLKKAIEDLLNDVRITLTSQAKSLEAGKKQDVTFLVKNDGPLPLRNFAIESKDCTFGGTFFLSERSERAITSEVEAPQAVGRNVIKAEWSGRTMDGHPVKGSQELAFEIVSANRSHLEIDLGLSPYFHGPPVGPDRNDVFFGRDALIQRITNQILSGNTVLLEGNRRSGKSSILRHLEGKDTIPGWIAVFADFQSAEGDKTKAGMPSEAVWIALAGAIVKGLAPLKIDLPLPNGTVLKSGSLLGYKEACRDGIGKEAPWEDFLEFFQTILLLLDSFGLGLVLMIDEFDKLQEGIDNKVTSPQIPENIRYLIQAHPRFVAIMTGSRRMQRLRHEYWSALYGLGNQIGVTALDPESARKLITEPVQGRLIYTNEAVDLVTYLTARQPYLIQYLCNRIFELARHRKIRSISRSIVDEAAKEFVRDNEHFASLWDYAETHRRRFILALCHKFARGPDPVTFGLLQEQLAIEQIEVTDAELDYDLKFLQELELVDFSGAEDGGVYRLTVPLMGQWLDQQHEYAALRSKAIIEQENTT